MSTTQLAKQVDRWKAVRRGAIYCAPACGMGCTKVAFDAATKKAEKLAHDMGPGWAPRVWENLGWHYSVSFGGLIDIHPNEHQKKTSYTVFVQTTPQFVARSTNVRKALADAVSELRATADTLKGAVLRASAA